MPHKNHYSKHSRANRQIVHHTPTEATLEISQKTLDTIEEAMSNIDTPGDYVILKFSRWYIFKYFLKAFIRGYL